MFKIKDVVRLHPEKAQQFAPRFRSELIIGQTYLRFGGEMECELYRRLASGRKEYFGWVEQSYILPAVRKKKALEEFA